MSKSRNDNNIDAASVSSSSLQEQNNVAKRPFKIGNYGVDHLLSFATYEGVQSDKFIEYLEVRKNPEFQLGAERGKPSSSWVSPQIEEPALTHEQEELRKKQAERCTKELNIVKNALFNDFDKVKFITKEENNKKVIYAEYKSKIYNMDELLKNGDLNQVTINKQQSKQYKKNLFGRIKDNKYTSGLEFQRNRGKKSLKVIESNLENAYQVRLQNYIVGPRFKFVDTLEKPNLPGLMCLRSTSEGMQYFNDDMSSPQVISWDKFPKDFPRDFPGKLNDITQIIELYKVSDIIMHEAYKNKSISESEMKRYKDDKNNVENLRQLPTEMKANLDYYSSGYYQSMNGLMRNTDITSNRNPPITINHDIVYMTLDKVVELGSNSEEKKEFIKKLERISIEHNNSPILFKNGDTIYLYKYDPLKRWHTDSVNSNILNSIKFPEANQGPLIMDTNADVEALVDKFHQRGNVGEVLLDVLTTLSILNKHATTVENTIRGDYSMDTTLVEKKEQGRFHERSFFSTAAGKSTYITGGRYQAYGENTRGNTAFLSLVSGKGFSIDAINEATSGRLVGKKGENVEREFEILQLPGQKQNELLYKRTYALAEKKDVLNKNDVIRTKVFYVDMKDGDLRYTVKNPEGKVVEGVISKDDMKQHIGVDTSSLDPFKPDMLKPYMTKILDYTSKRGDTYAEVHVLHTRDVNQAATTPQNKAKNDSQIKPKKESVEISPENKFDVVISGAGPVALASALEAIKLGKRVAIISDRDVEIDAKDQKTVFSRGQRIFLDEQSRYQLLKLFPSDFKNNPDDAKFFEHLTTDITIRVRDIERFMFRRIDELRKNDNQVVEFINRREVKSIDLENGNVVIGGSKKESGDVTRTLGFEYMIGADGARHHSADILNKDLPSESGIHYDKIAAPKHQYHAAVTVNIRVKKPIKLPDHQFIEVATKVDGKTYVAGVSLNEKKGDSEYAVIRCVFGGEVPKELFDKIQNHNNQKTTEDEKKAVKDEVASHMAQVLAEELGVEPGALDIQFRQTKEYKQEKGISEQAHKSYERSKDILGLQAFETTLIKADKACQENNGHKFLLAGDAYRRPNYQFGHGLNHAFRHAQNIGQVLGGEVSTKEYDKRCDELSKEVEVANSLLNKLGKVGRNLLVQAGNERPDRVRKQFSGLKNPQAAEIISPINQYLDSVTLLTGHKSSAKRLIADIKSSNQRPWDILLRISNELHHAKSKAYPFEAKHDKYIKMLEKSYHLALTAYRCEFNLEKLTKNEELVEKIKNLEEFMRKEGFPRFENISQAIVNNDYILLESHSAAAYARRREMGRGQREKPEGKEFRLLAEVLVNNANGKYTNSDAFVNDVEKIVNQLHDCKNEKALKLNSEPVVKSEPVEKTENMMRNKV